MSIELHVQLFPKDVSKHSEIIRRLIDVTMSTKPLCTRMLQDGIEELDRQKAWQISGLNSVGERRAWYKYEATKLHTLWTFA